MCMCIQTCVCRYPQTPEGIESLELELQAVESCWELNLVILREQFMLLTSEPFLQILNKNLKPKWETPALQNDSGEL